MGPRRESVGGRGHQQLKKEKKFSRKFRQAPVPGPRHTTAVRRHKSDNRWVAIADRVERDLRPNCGVVPKRPEKLGDNNIREKKALFQLIGRHAAATRQTPAHRGDGRRQDTSSRPSVAHVPCRLFLNKCLVLRGRETKRQPTKARAMARHCIVNSRIRFGRSMWFPLSDDSGRRLQTTASLSNSEQRRRHYQLVPVGGGCLGSWVGCSHGVGWFRRNRRQRAQSVQPHFNSS